MANCFIVACEDTHTAVVIDPGDEADRILLGLAESKLTLKYILNTHGHFDHVAANKKMKDATGADLIIHALDAPMLSQISASASMWGLSGDDSPPPDRTVAEGDTIPFGNLSLAVLHTPGVFSLEILCLRDRLDVPILRGAISRLSSRVSRKNYSSWKKIPVSLPAMGLKRPLAKRNGTILLREWLKRLPVGTVLFLSPWLRRHC